MYTKSITHYIAKITVDIMFVLSIICSALVPFVADPVFIWFINESYLIPFTTCVFLSGLCCIYILFHLKQMYRSLLVGDPFIDENVSHFRKIAVACAAIALIYIAKCIFMFTISTVIIVFVFVVGTLFCLTLKDLFKQAINYKTENELTI